MLKKHYITFLRVLKFLVLKEDTITVLKYLKVHSQVWDIF